MLITIVGAAVVLAVLVAVVSARRPGIRGDGPAGALRLAALAATLLAAALLAPSTVEDSPEFAPFALGIPVLLAAVPVLAQWSDRGVTVATWVAALGLTAWALLLGLGIGVYLLPAAMLLLAAAAVQHRSAVSS